MYDPIPLNNQVADYVAAAMKGALGVVPVVGSALAEFAGMVIPNQRLDRLVKFAAALEGRLSSLEQEALRASLRDPVFGDMVEESMRQAASSLTDERRAYLASVVANSLDEDGVSASDSRHILRLLSQISDVEAIVLRSHLIDTFGGDEAFRKRHAAVLEPVAAFLNSDSKTHDKEAMWRSHREHLTQLGLLRQRLKIDNKTKQPAFDASRGEFLTSGHDLTRMGRLVLRMIGVTQDGFNPTEGAVEGEQVDDDESTLLG